MKKYPVYIACSVFLCIACDNKSQWEGTIETQDTHYKIYNSGKGLYEGLKADSITIVQKFGGIDSPLFSRIAWIEFDENNNIFVLDGMNNTVTKLAADGQVITQFGKFGQGPGELNGCRRFVYAFEKLFLANTKNNRIEVFRTDGQILPSIKLEEAENPAFILFHQNYFYVGERFSPEKHYLYKYDENWNLIQKIIRAPKYNHPLDYIRDMHKRLIGQDGIWCVFYFANKVLKYDSNYNLQFEMSKELGWEQQKLQGIPISDHGVAGSSCLDPAGNLYAVYYHIKRPGAWNHVYKFGKDGKYHYKAFVLPEDQISTMRFGNDGFFYFSDGVTLYKAKIQTYDLKKP